MAIFHPGHLGRGHRSLQLVAAAAPAIIVVSNITYSQSSVYAGLQAATNAGMTNGNADEPLQTGTNSAAAAFVQMDLGAVLPVAKIFIGHAGVSSLGGGWSGFPGGQQLRHSVDGTNFTTIQTIPLVLGGTIQQIDVSLNTRFIRIQNNSWVAVTEFFATST